MSEQRCETCKWWQPLQIDPWASKPRVEVFRGEGPAPGRWGECTRVANGMLDDASDRFLVKDASDYAAWLITRDNFGCVEWEPHDTEETA